jgi:hypothetical protein
MAMFERAGRGLRGLVVWWLRTLVGSEGDSSRAAATCVVIPEQWAPSGAINPRCIAAGCREVDV